MKKLLYLLLFPLSSFAQISDANLNLEADTIRTETHAGRNTAQRVGRMFKNIIANKPNTAGGGTTLSVAGGGTGTTTPGLVAGTNINITGSWPNQTINVTGGGGGITNSAPANHLMESNGTNAIDAGIVLSGFSGSLTLGASAGTWKFSQGVYVAPSAFPFTGASGLFQANQTNATTNTVMYPAAVSRGLTAGTAAAGIGTGIEFLTINNAGTYVSGSTVESVETSVAAGSENFDIVFKNTSTGVGLQEVFRIRSDGTTTIEAPWQNLTLSNGWASVAGGNTVQFRIVGTSTVQLRGVLDGSLASSDNFATGHALPDPQVAGGQANISIPICNTTPGFTQLQIHGSAGLGIIPSHAVLFYDLNGVSYTK